MGLVVVGLHLAGVLLWWTTERGMQWVRSEPRLGAIAVWLPVLAQRDTKKAESANQPPSAQAPGKPGGRGRSSPADPNHTADLASTPTTGSSITVPSETPGSVEVQTQTRTAPALNLNLSRKAITSVAPPSFAEQSPFHGRLPATVERQIASAAAETGPWTEERIDIDHIRFRRGNTCVMMERPRAAAIDPFSEAMARIPWRAGRPEDCQ